MAVTDITAETLRSFVEDNEIVLIDFWASWCGPCRYFAPIFENAAALNPDVGFGKVDTEAQAELAHQFGIMSIPTLIAFRDGIIVYAQPGALPQEALDDLLDQIRALDMEEVHKKVKAAS